MLSRTEGDDAKLGHVGDCFRGEKTSFPRDNVNGAVATLTPKALSDKQQNLRLCGSSGSNSVGEKGDEPRAVLQYKDM